MPLIFINVILCTVPPFAAAFGLATLTMAQWAWVFGLSLSVVAVGEVYKFFLRTADRRLKRGKGAGKGRFFAVKIKKRAKSTAAD